MIGIKPGKLALGGALMGSFLAVLVAIFMPLIDGDNALNYLDNLYNSISKASANYFSKVEHEVEKHQGEAVTLTLKMEDEAHAERAAVLLRPAADQVAMAGNTVTVQGDLSVILYRCLNDADAMYNNRGAEVAERHGMNERVALHGWWQILGAMEKDLNRQKSFAAAKLSATVKTKTVECAYNYYRIEPQPITERWGIVLFSLVFYVVYTVWYGYAVMYLFEGLGYELSSH